VQPASDEFTVEEVKRWIAEARELAIYETEKRMRAEFAALEQGKKNKEQGQEVGGGDAGKGGTVGVKNTDFYLPADGAVVGDNTNNDGKGGVPVKKRRTYTMITAKYTAKRHFDYVKIR